MWTPVDHDPDVPTFLADEGLRLSGNPLGQPVQGVAHPGCGPGVPAVSGFDQPGRLGYFDPGSQDLMAAVVVLVPEGILDFAGGVADSRVRWNGTEPTPPDCPAHCR